MSSKPAAAQERQIEAILTGFITDGWNKNPEEKVVDLMLVARQCSQRSHEDRINRYRTVKNLANILQKKADQEHLFISKSNSLLEELPQTAEEAAMELRRRQGSHAYAASRSDLFGALGVQEVISLRAMPASALLLRYGETMRILATKEGEPWVRQRFSIAHEIGHAVLDAARTRSPEDIEGFCDEFAAAYLMPRDLVTKFAADAYSFVLWLDFPSTFDVSTLAAAKRIWKSHRKLLIAPGIIPKTTPRPIEAAELVRLGEKVGSNDLRGVLGDNIRYIIRRTKRGVEAIADFAGQSEVNQPAE